MAQPRRRSGQAKSRAARRRGPRPLPGWIWGLGGLAVGLSVALLVHLQHLAAPQHNRLDALFEPPAEEQPEGATAKDTDRNKPSFEFYRLLPEQEVAVPEPQRQPATRREPAPQPTPEATATTGGSQGGAAYLLQAGSFRSYADADRMKAQLALLGIEARIQKVDLTGGETWHRVRIGPVTDRNRINDIRARLSRNEIESILLKRGG